MYSYVSGSAFNWTYNTVNDGSCYNPVLTGLTCFDTNTENTDGDVVYADNYATSTEKRAVL